MLIALDYDKTYTTDPELWNLFIKEAQSRGHFVSIVTMRYNTTEERILNPPCGVIYTEREAKIKHIKADIWIDDNPGWIFEDAIY